MDQMRKRLNEMKIEWRINQGKMESSIALKNVGIRYQVTLTDNRITELTAIMKEITKLPS